jgi:hypothetical protein
LNYNLDLLAIGTSCLALYYIVRAKRTFFLDSGFFIAVATVGFIAYLAEATVSSLANLPVSIPINTLLVAIMGSSIGVASYLLKDSDERTISGISQLRTFFSKPPMGFIAFLATIWLWTILALEFQPWTLNEANAGDHIFYYSYSAWFVVASALLLASFIGLPVFSFYRQSSKVQEKAASQSMKIISVCWTMFGISLFFQIAEGGVLLPLSQSLGFIMDSLLFVLISFALREPTVLARIITAREAVSQVVSLHSGEDTIVLYNTESDRKKLVERFVKDGLASGQTIICRVTKSEVPFYRAILKSPDLAGTTVGKPEVEIKAIETASSDFQDLTPESRLSIDRRELVDLDELGLERSKEIIEYVNNLDSKTVNTRTGRIWALNVDGAQAGILEVLTATNPRSRVIDLAQQQDTFASLLGWTHQDTLGGRMLLEYDPTSNYEEIVQKFVREFQANVEPVAVFTNAGSPVYRILNEQKNIRLFSSSTKTSTPLRISDEQVLLPERDTSLLLDAVDKLLQAHSGRRIGIVLEVFTYLILSLGFEKAYGVLSSVLEMAESQLTTILVLVNSAALDDRVMSGIRGLFQSQLAFNSNGLRSLRQGVDGHGRREKFAQPVSYADESHSRVEV